LNVFQISVILLYVSMGKVSGGTAPIVPPSMVSHGHAEVAHGDHGHGDQHGDHGGTAHVKEAHGSHVEADDHHPDHQDHSHNEDGQHSGDSAQHDDHGDHAHADDEIHEVAEGSGAHSVAADTKHSKLIYSNPLPSVLMLTAIVVGIATTALALALIVRIREDYGTIEEDEILELDRAA